MGCTNKPAESEVLLKDAYASQFKLGVALPNKDIDPAEKKLLKHYLTVTPENAMKPGVLQPRLGKFTYEFADKILRIAHENNMTVNGHTLLWYDHCPDWFKVDKEEATRRALEHIRTVVTRFAGQVVSWDVVNEAISAKDGPNEYLRTGDDCSNNITEDLIYDAFVTAHQADPLAELYYNDFDLEYNGKRGRLLKLLDNLEKRGTPITGVALQGHWTTESPTIAEIEKTIQMLNGRGLKVVISELDINVIRPLLPGKKDPKDEQGQAEAYEKIQEIFANGIPAEIDQKLTNRYKELFELFRRQAKAIDRVTFWGLHDGRNWLVTKNYNYLPEDTSTSLPFDKNKIQKNAFKAILDAGQ